MRVSQDDPMKFIDLEDTDEDEEADADAARNLPPSVESHQDSKSAEKGHMPSGSIPSHPKYLQKWEDPKFQLISFTLDT
jgi:hypothetical protein